MLFEERELKAHAEPVSISELKVGTIYFSLSFVDEAMLVPMMEPVVFVGRDLGPEEDGQVYFQDFDSFRRGVRYSSAVDSDGAEFVSGPESSLGHVYEFERALDALLRCSLRRQRSRSE